MLIRLFEDKCQWNEIRLRHWHCGWDCQLVKYHKVPCREFNSQIGLIFFRSPNNCAESECTLSDYMFVKIKLLYGVYRFYFKFMPPTTRSKITKINLNVCLLIYPSSIL